MEYNKNQFIKSSDHKVLHKVKKNWVVLSMSLLALLGGGAVARQTVAHADPNGTQANNPTTTLKNRINASLDRAQTASSQQTAQTNVHNNQRANAQQISQQANQLHNRIVSNAALTSDDNGASSATDQQTSQTQSQNQKSQPQKPSTVPAQQHRTQQARALNFVQHGVNHHDYDHQANSPVNQNSDQSTASSNSAVQSNSASTSGVKSSVSASRISAMGNEASTSVNNGKTEQANQVSVNSDKQNAKEGIANQPQVGSDNSNYVDANDDQAWNKITDWSKTGTDQGLNYKYAPKENALEFISGTLKSSTDFSDLWNNIGSSIKSVKFDNGVSLGALSSMNSMFDTANHRNLQLLQSVNLGNLNTSKITSLHYMFANANNLRSLNLGSNFNTSNVTDMQAMFQNDSSLQSLDLGNKFDTSNVASTVYSGMNGMFQNDKSLKTLNLGNKFYVGNNIKDTSSMFQGDSSLQSLDLGPHFNTNSVTNMNAMFASDNSLQSLNLGPHFNTSNVTNMGGLFNNDKNLRSLNLGPNFDTSKVSDMSFMFDSNDALKSLDLGNKFNTSRVTNMYAMFSSDKDLQSLDLGSSFDTSKVSDMQFMFQGDSSLQSLDLGQHFNTGNVTNMGGLFNNDKNLRSLNLGPNFDTSKVSDMSFMFASNDALKSLDLGNKFNTSRVTNMNYMFNNDNNLQSLTIASSKTKLNKTADLPIMYKEIDGTAEIGDTPNDFSKGNTGTFTDFISTSDIYGNVDGKTAPTNPSQIKDASDWNDNTKPDGWSYVDANGMPIKNAQNDKNGKAMVAPVYYGLTYKYDKNQNSFEFIGGKLNKNDNYTISYPNNHRIYIYTNGSFAGGNKAANKTIGNASSIKFDPSVDSSDLKNACGMFWSNSNLKSVTFSPGFGKNVTNADHMFANDNDLQHLTLPSGFGQKITNTSSMFDSDNHSLHSLTLNDSSDYSSTFKNYLSMSNADKRQAFVNDDDDNDIGQLYLQLPRQDSNGKHYTTLAVNFNNSNPQTGTYQFTSNVPTSDIYGGTDGMTAPVNANDIKPASDWCDPSNNGQGDKDKSDKGPIIAPNSTTYSTPSGWSYVDQNGNPVTTPQKDSKGNVMVAPVYYGLTYKYNKNINSVEFIGGKLNWNSHYNFNSNSDKNNYDNGFIGMWVNNQNASNMNSDIANIFKNVKSVTFDNNVRTSELQNAAGMFISDSALTSLSLPSRFGQNIKDTSQMFENETGLTSLSLPSGFGQNIIEARNMFSNNSNSLQSIHLPQGFGKNIKDADSMFEFDTKLSTLTLPDGFGQNIMGDPNDIEDPVSMLSDTGLTSLTLDNPSSYSKAFKQYLSMSPSDKKSTYGSDVDGSNEIGQLYLQLPHKDNNSKDPNYGQNCTTSLVDFTKGTPQSGTYLLKSVKATGYIYFKTLDSQEVGSPQYYSDYYGDTKTVTPPAGYRFTDGSSVQIPEDGNPHPLTVLDAHTYSRPINFIYSNDNKNYNENTIDDNGHKNYDLIGKVGTSQKFTAGSQNVYRLNPGWQVASDKTVTINSNSDKPQNVNVVPIHQNDSVHFVLSGNNVPAGYHGKTGLIASDSTDYSGNDYWARDAGNNSYTFNDQASNGIKGLPNGYQIAGNLTINHGKQTINYDGQTHDIQVAPVSIPASINYVNASDDNQPIGGTSTVNFYPVIDGSNNTKQVTVSDLESKSGFPSGGYEIYPPSQQSVTINKNGSTVIPVAKQHVVATGNWDMDNSKSARFEVVSDQQPSNPANGQFTPDNSDNTLIFISPGPLDVNSWSKAGYVDNHGKKQYVFSSDAQHSDGNSSYPNALNRNSISKVFFNPGITVKLPVGIPAGTTANKNLPNGAKSDVGLFQSMHNLKEIDFNSALDGSDAQNLSSMFANDEQLKKIDLGNLEASKVTVTSDMFAGDTALSDLTLPQNGFGKLTDIAGMFASDKSLVGNAGGTHADDNDNYNPIKKATEDIHYLSDMVVSNVTDMDSVFESDSNLQGLNLSGWQNSKNLSDMDAMFANDKQLRYLDISQLTNPNMIIGGALSDFQNDFAHPDPNNPSNSNGKYAVVLNNQMHLGSDSLLGGYWSSSDYKNDPELFSPRRIDQYGANLGPNSSATWTKVANNPSDLHDQTRQVRLYNQDNGYIGTRTVDVPKPDKNGNYLIDLSDQLRSQSMPIGYQLPPKNGYLSDIVDGNLLKRISDSSISYNDYNGHPKAYLLGYSDTQTLPVTIEYNDKPGVVEHRTIKVTGYYGDTNDAVPASDWQPGPGMNYQFDQNKSSDVYDGLLHYNMMDHGSGYQPNGNAQWNIQPKYCSRNPAQPLLYYDNRANTLLRVIYVDQSGQQVGSSDSISGPDGEVVNVTDPDDNGIKVPNGYHLIGGMTNVNKVNSDDGVYGSDQDTVYTLNGKQRTVYLHVQGDSDKYATVQVHLVMTDANGHMTTTKKSVNLNSLDGHQVHDGDEIELNPSDSQIKPQGYSADYSKDSVQFIQIGNDGKPIPNDFTFYYRSTNTTGAPIAIRYTDTDGHEVGSIKVLQGNIGDPVTVNKQAVDNKQITLPTGYSLINDKESDNRTFTDSPQIMDVKVQGNQYKGGPFVITQYDNGKQGDQYNIYVSDARVGDSFTVSPYGFSIGGVISSISGPNGSTSYNFPKSDHATPSDPDLTVRIDSDGKLSQPSINYNYQSNNVNQTKLSTIHIHYITLDKGIKMSDGNKLPDPFKSYHELDKESDSGTSNDTFDLTPYTDDIPESVSQYYDGVINQTTSSDVVDGSNNIIKLNPSGSGYQWKFGAQPTDVYIKVHKNGDGNQPIIID